MPKFTPSEFDAECIGRPQGYQADLLSVCATEGELIVISDIDYNAIKLRYAPPSVLAKIRSLTEAAVDAVRSGLDVRDGDETAAILPICAICPHLITEPFICGVCYCHISVKMQLKSWHCPLGKW